MTKGIPTPLPKYLEIFRVGGHIYIMISESWVIEYK